MTGAWLESLSWAAPVHRVLGAKITSTQAARLYPFRFRAWEWLLVPIAGSHTLRSARKIRCVVLIWLPTQSTHGLHSAANHMESCSLQMIAAPTLRWTRR